MLIGVPSAAPATRIPGTHLVVGDSGFDGGWTIYRRACDACGGRPCPKHLLMIEAAYRRRSAQSAAVVAEAELVAASAANSLVPA